MNVIIFLPQNLQSCLHLYPSHPFLLLQWSIKYPPASVQSICFVFPPKDFFFWFDISFLSCTLNVSSFLDHPHKNANMLQYFPLKTKVSLDHTSLSKEVLSVSSSLSLFIRWVVFFSLPPIQSSTHFNLILSLHWSQQNLVLIKVTSDLNAAILDKLILFKLLPSTWHGWPLLSPEIPFSLSFHSATLSCFPSYLIACFSTLRPLTGKIIANLITSAHTSLAYSNSKIQLLTWNLQVNVS